MIRERLALGKACGPFRERWSSEVSVLGGLSEPRPKSPAPRRRGAPVAAASGTVLGPAGPPRRISRLSGKWWNLRACEQVWAQGAARPQGRVQSRRQPRATHMDNGERPTDTNAWSGLPLRVRERGFRLWPLGDGRRDIAVYHVSPREFSRAEGCQSRTRGCSGSGRRESGGFTLAGGAVGVAASARAASRIARTLGRATGLSTRDFALCVSHGWARKARSLGQASASACWSVSSVPPVLGSVPSALWLPVKGR